jgi:hypothetical protein
MLAHAFLVAAVTQQRGQSPPFGLIGLTCNQVKHPFAALIMPPVKGLGHQLRWSVWRRRQQARARSCHYRRDATWQP